MPKPNEISNETLDRLIAEHVCGWRWFSRIEGPFAERGTSPFESGAWLLHPDSPVLNNRYPYGVFLVRSQKPDGSTRYINVPQYSNDLNQCHEAELMLSDKRGLTGECRDYAHELEWSSEDGIPLSRYGMITADARTRCIAMLTALGVDLEGHDAKD